MRKLLSLVAITILTLSCQMKFDSMEDFPFSGTVTKASADYSVSVQANKPIEYFTTIDFKSWTSIRGLDNRFAACDTPDYTLKRMTTEALVKSILHYPLNYIIFAYDDPQMAINIVFKHSRLHRELSKREDAAAAIVKAFAETSIDMNIGKSCFDDDYKVLSYSNEMFFDYFAASGLIPNISSGDNKEILREAVLKKLKERASDKYTYSMFSLRPLLSINEKEGLQIPVSSWKESNSNAIFQNDSLAINTCHALFNTISSATVYTYFRKPITGLINEELTNYEIVNITNNCVTQYPNAILRGSTTSLYNCHSYAWYSSSLNNNVWINNCDSNGNFQLSKYWTNDLYDSCSSATAEKAYYSDSDHSANVLASGKYLSKWGWGPLMEHDYDDCPYGTSNMQYYQERNEPIYMLTICGDTNVMKDSSHDYYISQLYSDMTCNWTVTYLNTNAPNTYDFTLLNSSYLGTYRLTCYEYGAYQIRVDGYHNGNHVAYGQLLVVSLGTN